MPTYTALPANVLSETFSYDPATGFLAWKVNTPRTRAGDEAGTVTANKTIVVSYKGHKIPAENICWALVHASWPNQPLRFRNGDRQDLRFDNLEPYTHRPAVSAKAIAMRQYRERLRERKRAERTAWMTKAAADLAAEYPNIAWSHKQQCYTIEEPPKMPFLLPHDVPKRRVIGTAPTFEDAVLIYQDHITCLDIALAAPDPAGIDQALLDLTPTARGIYTVTYGEMVETFTYDRETGWFVTRYPVTLFGFRHDKPFSRADRSPRYVPIKGRRYYAHQLAWFMTYHVWPAPRAIIHRDGDPSNNALANLLYKDQSDDHQD